MSTKYNVVALNPQSTVVSEYDSEKDRSTKYQSEHELEKSFIQQLQAQAYEYVPIKNEEGLKQNLRIQLEKLNDYQFSNKEWKRFFDSYISNKNQGIKEKTNVIQEDYIKILTRDDGTSKNIRLIQKDNIHDNYLQVINQYEANEGKRKNRYDVTILVNGLPLVHVELKKRGSLLREAFNQINRYQRESFWSESGLFEYVQLFVISNGTQTKYYSNTTRSIHLKESSRLGKDVKSRSNSYEFTSWWTDEKNNPIRDLMCFAETFFAKHTLLSILTRYCVYTSEEELLVMRPYQIAATEHILRRIEISANYKKYGTIDAGGYIWHTTGSGKTLTSFKTAQLACKLPDLEKILFVVDRKDLDYQTMKEYDKFQKGAANGNASTKILTTQFENPQARIIITTIQKLDRFIKKNAKHSVFKKHVVIIFDECHRSQFGSMHQKIVQAFKKYHLFGFTGTPIFPVNAPSSSKTLFKTTEQVFGSRLHSYTVVNAITDENVLPFKVDWVQTFREEERIENNKVPNIDREAALNSPKRHSKIVDYILKQFNQKTKRNATYKLSSRRLKGFNSLFAVSSIDAAKKYYQVFQSKMKTLPSDKKLKIALIYSYNVNENDDNHDGLIDENLENTEFLEQGSRDFLDDAIQDYNAMFKTSFDTSSEKFQNYYKDVSQRVKEREIDLLIVVNMFLTGFDAKTLNTLWLDKNLRLHGLMQAFSRTNRILNRIKNFGNIVSFRNLEKSTNEAIALFGDEKAKGIVLLKKYQDYYDGYTENNKEFEGYKSIVEKILSLFPLKRQIIGEQNEKDFILLFNKQLKLKNVLETFDEFSGNEILSERDQRDYQSIYLDLYQKHRKKGETDVENINDDLIFEIELIKQVDINVDYILDMVKKYHEKHTRDKHHRLSIEKAINSSVSLRNKKDLIMEFIDHLNVQSDIDKDWPVFVEQKWSQELDAIIEKENLKRNCTYEFMIEGFKNGFISSTGTSMSKCLPPMSRFDPAAGRREKKELVHAELSNHFEKFQDITGDSVLENIENQYL